MATYRNKQDDIIIRGSEFKVNISMDVIDEYHMEDVDFLCTFKAGGKVVHLTKEDMIEVDADRCGMRVILLGIIQTLLGLLLCLLKL